jgi:hypothetical protein
MSSSRNPSQLTAFNFMAIVRRTAESAVESALAAREVARDLAGGAASEATAGAAAASAGVAEHASQLMLAPHELRARCGVLPFRTVNFRGSYGTTAPLPAHLMDLRR